jgi:hypothetical protein
MAAEDMLGSKMRTFGPKLGVSGWVGQDAAAPIVNVALATEEFVRPEARPMACTVVEVAMVIGPVYRGEPGVGVEPSTVYRMLAPGVASVIVTACAVA